MGLVAPEVVTGSAPTGLHFVAHEQDVVGIEHLVHGAEEAVGRRGETADSLDRLGDQARDVARGHHVDDLDQVADGPLGEALVVEAAIGAAELVGPLHEVDRQPGVTRVRPAAMRRDRLRREGTAVVAVAHREYLVGLAVLGCKHDRGVVGFASRRREEDPRVRDPRDRRDLLGELDHGLAQVERGRVHDLGGLGLHGGDDIGLGVADHRREHAAEPVEIPVALEVEHIAALAPIDRDRVVVERRDVRRKNRSVPIGEFSVCCHQSATRGP